MTSVQRYLSGRHNRARTAALVASSVHASTAIERTHAQRAGGGRVRLAGAYTGHEAAQVDVEIVAAGGTPRASVPQFVGVGNGTLAVQAIAADAPLQTFTFTLADLGVPTATAGLDVREVRIRAKVAGAAGNSIRIAVQPQLVRTPTAWALLGAWAPGQPTQAGPQWDFGGLPLSADGALDPASPRIQFGDDPQVYRPYREFKDGDWRFGLSPDLQRPVAEGTKVFGVTGGYLVTVTDGATTETFGDTGAAQPMVRTFYDLLQALAGSALVEVAGVVAADRRAGGQAVVDVPLRTQAWLLAMSGRTRLESVTVPGSAPTQTVVVRCINDDVVGRERWSVAGDVSGALPAATTGEPYTSTAVNFTVPAVVAAAAEVAGRWSFKFNPMARLDTQGLPSVCVRPFRFGSNARPLTVTFRYSRRPPADCKCTDMPTPKLSLKCLGLTQGDDMALEPAYQTRLQALYAWRRDFIAANTEVDDALVRFSQRDMDFVDVVTDAFAAALAEVFETAPALTEWDAAFAQMEAELSWMAGFGSVEGIAVTRTQGGTPGSLWLNPVSKKIFRLVTVDGTTTEYTQGISPGWPAWTDPDDPVWDTSGTPFVITVSVSDSSGNPVDRDLEYRCLPNLTLADLHSTVDAATIEQLMRRYRARMDHVRTLAGIVPKSESSSGDAGGCWIDHGDTFWWVDVDGYYLPAFTNQAYVSARRNTDTGKAYSTMEFGFGLVVACPERLMLGDELTLRLEQVDAERQYRVGDEAVLQTVGASAAWLSGGVNGTDEHTWRVAGSDAGALPDYVVPTGGAAVPPYIADGATVLLAPGGIPFALGDSFTFAVEAGQYRWRTNEGAWSAPADVPAAGVAALADGLQVHFDAGAAPSFAAGDAYGFAVRQPNAASHVRDGSHSQWAWAGASASMVLDFGSTVPLAVLAMARYDLPPSAGVSVQASDDGLAWSAAQAVAFAGRPVAMHSFAPDTAARYLRVTVVDAEGGSIGWLWAGTPLATTYSASTVQRTRRWAVERGQGPNAAALYAGAGDGWSIAWESASTMGGCLTQADATALLEVVDWAQLHDEPLIFVPHHAHPEDAALVRATAEAIDITDVHEYQPNAAGKRRLQAALTLEPLFA